MSFTRYFPSQVVVLCLLLTSQVTATKNGTVIPLKSSSYGLWYTAELEFGGLPLSVITDTGSADLWVLGENWKCVPNGVPVPRSRCPSNQSYVESASFQPIEDAYLGELYGQGIIIGPVGYEDLQLGSLAISQQEMAFVNSTTNGVDSSVSGLMGLAFPVLDQVHPSSYVLKNLTAATAEQKLLSDRIAYPTVIERLMGMGITYFSFAMERTPLDQEIGFGGYLSFGTLPPVAHGDFVTIPVEVTQALPLIWSNGTKQIAYWTLTIDEVTWDGQKNTQPFQAVVDSGNGINFLPQEIAVKFNAAFDPPGKLDASTGYWSVNCDATPPASLGLQIGGHVFDIDAADMIFRDAAGNCFSSLSASPKAFGTEIAILGDTFLKNVVAVFDYSQKEMKFAPRQTNSSSTSPTPSTGGATGSMKARNLLLVVVVGLMAAALA